MKRNEKSAVPLARILPYLKKDDKNDSIRDFESSNSSGDENVFKRAANRSK